jgi:hypothetical protein
MAALATTLVVLGACTVLIGLATAILGLFSQRRIMKLAAEQAKAGARLQQISVSVNGKMDGLFNRVDQLIGSMHAQGAVVPAAPPAAPVAPEAPPLTGG